MRGNEKIEQESDTSGQNLIRPEDIFPIEGREIYAKKANAFSSSPR